MDVINVDGVIRLFKEARHPEVDWMASAFPHWKYVGNNANTHPQYQWIDPNGNPHMVTGYIGQHGAGNSSPLQRAQGNLTRYLRRCENGACSHVFNATTTEQAQQPQAVQPYTIGSQVSYQGQPHYVVAGEPLDGEHYYDLAHAQTGEQQQMIPHSALDTDGLQSQANILDPIEPTLAEIWDDPKSDHPTLKPRYAHFIKKHVHTALERNGYQNLDRWIKLFITGSLTTYQYGPNSDLDVSIFVDSDKFPETTRAHMVGVMTSEIDGLKPPGVPYPLQVYVVPEGIKPTDIYKEGLRSGYDIDNQHWIAPPDKSRVMDVDKMENAWYTHALMQADKMEQLLTQEPSKALKFYHQIHRRRQWDQAAGKGDFGIANIIYKMMESRGLLNKLHFLEKQSTTPDISQFKWGDYSGMNEAANNSSRFQYQYQNSTPDWHGDRHYFQVAPAGAPATHTITLGDKSRNYGYDPELVDPPTEPYGEWGWKGHPEWQPDNRDAGFAQQVQAEPNMLYRGMSHEEWENAKQNGYFQTKGEYNIANEGGTLFSTNPVQARNYASGFAPWQREPGFNTPGYVVAIPRPDNAFPHPNQDPTTTEIVVPGQIPFNQVSKAWQFRPYAMSHDDNMAVWSDDGDTWNGRPSLGNRGNAFREVPLGN